jgi:hypothetical protein
VVDFLSCVQCVDEYFPCNEFPSSNTFIFEFKQIQKLKLESEKLKAENRALTRVVSKLSGNSSVVSGSGGNPTGNGPKG